MTKKLLTLSLALFAALTLAVVPAHAILVTFADYTDLSGHPLTVAPSGGSSTISGVAIPIHFEFKNLIGAPSNPNLVNNNVVNATLDFSLTSTTSGTDNGTTLTENGWFGTINIYWTPAQAAFYGAGAQTHLLKMVDSIGGTNTGGSGSGNSAGSSMTISASTPPLSEIVFTSDYIFFGGEIAESYGITFGSSGPIALTGGATGFLNTNTFSSSGNFNIDPAPSFAPEPATMGLLGSALVGLGMIGRRRLVRK